MAVTKQVYTATATWTAAQLATIFETAFIDAGLMTAWYDSYASGGNEHRIMEVTYDAAKLYGKTYYWFIFNTSGAYIAITTGWNTTTNLPVGTQYLDWLGNNMGTTTNHWTLLALSATTAATITRYTSGVTASHSWFTVKQGATFYTFHIIPPSATIQPWVDLDKVFFNGALTSLLVVSSLTGSIGWGTLFRLRRCITGQCLRGDVAANNYGPVSGNNRVVPFRYAVYGNANNSGSNGQGNFAQSSPAIILPNAFANVNSAYGANVNPVYHSLAYSQFTSTPLPSDIGIAFHYANNTMVHGDTLVVTAAAEEWEIIDRANNATATDGASPLFLARLI